MRLIAVLSAVAVLLSSCAAPQPLATPTGRPEVTIATGNTAAVKGRIITVCAQSGYMLVNESPSMLVFSRRMDLNQATLYTVAMGNAYSSYPMVIARFSLTNSGGGNTRVFAALTTSMQNAFGQESGMDMSLSKEGHALQAVLELIKSEFEGKRKKNS